MCVGAGGWITLKEISLPVNAPPLEQLQTGYGADGTGGDTEGAGNHR